MLRASTCVFALRCADIKVTCICVDVENYRIGTEHTAFAFPFVNNLSPRSFKSLLWCCREKGVDFLCFLSFQFEVSTVKESHPATDWATVYLT